MEWLADLDLAGFRCINQTLANPVLDLVLPFFSGNRLFGPALVVLGVWLIGRGGVKGRCFVGLLILALAVGDQALVGPLKNEVGRARPYVTMPETRVLVGRGSDYASFPSSHATNAACAAAVTACFYRRARGYIVGLAALVGLSRVYGGAHYPSDVLGGWALGAATGYCVCLASEGIWRSLGRRWFPLWWAACPSISGGAASSQESRLPTVSGDQHWIRLGDGFLGVLLMLRLYYLGTGTLELSEDEAYQWLWSKHLDWSFYSKPPGIALAQWLGTHVAGNTELGVRLLSPVLACVVGAGALRFLAVHTSGRTAFLFLTAVLATPLLTVGSTLITVDPLLVACWMVALFTGWRAWTRDSTAWWLATGAAWGGAFLCKFASPFLWGSWICFWVAHPPARRQLRRPGIWIALAINVLCMIPVLVWNDVHGWPTLHHLADRSGLSERWRFKPDFFFDFILVAPLLLNPFFFAAMVHASIAAWRSRNQKISDRVPPLSRPLLTYLWCLGGPLFLFYFAYTLRARVQPNWIAASVLPLLMFATVYWHHRWRAGDLTPRRYLAAGLALGLPIVLILHQTNWVAKLIGRPLPTRYEPLKRVRGYRELSRLVGEQRERLERASGRPTFIIADHYGRTGLLSFYLPEARASVGTARPLVVVRSSDQPENQFWFWPEYRYASRHGENAIYVMEADTERPAPERLVGEFAKVESLGLFDANYQGRRFHRVQLFACRGLH